mgnify:CR=1 FL=1
MVEVSKKEWYKLIKLKAVIILLFCLTLTFKLFATSPCNVVSLRCEYLTNPLGIDTKAPRLTWRLDDGRRGAKQVAFQVLVSTSGQNFSTEENLQWNSGKIYSAATFIHYNGKELQPFTTYYWKVIVWDKDSIETEASVLSSFETGIMGSITGRELGYLMQPAFMQNQHLIFVRHLKQQRK